jgi:hypothetical protein
MICRPVVLLLPVYLIGGLSTRGMCEGLTSRAGKGFSSGGTISDVKHVKWLVGRFEQIVRHAFPVADTTGYSRCFQGGTAGSVLSHAQKQGKCPADTTMRMPNVGLHPCDTGRPGRTACRKIATCPLLQSNFHLTYRYEFTNSQSTSFAGSNGFLVFSRCTRGSGA